SRVRTRNGFPRRLVYVVNRRTVVDQATREAEGLRKALLNKPKLQRVAELLRPLGARASDAPLAISTLRGQFADNAEWRDDPARPAVIVGTVDMIGSRLLFSGYGRGFKTRPLHAGFLAQDALLVHDEAHLEPAFQELISSIESEQQRCREFGCFRVVALTATPRGDGEEGLVLTDADRKHAEVRKRIKAKKGIVFLPVDDDKKLPERVAERALKHKNSGQAILVFLRKLEDVEKVAGQLAKTSTAQALTGTMRGLERDALAKDDAVFARFLPEVKRVAPPEKGTVYLVCTSAGEVGVDMSADHLVCDLSPFDSMAQRFGRVNRFGNGDAWIDVVHVSPSKSAGTEVGPDTADSSDGVGHGGPKKGKSKAPSPFDQRCARTLSLLQQLHQREDQRYDASPAAIGALPAADRQAAFTPQPAVLPTSEILFDAWALTSIREKLPGRPPVADWLHGVAEWEPPETHIAWREETSVDASKPAMRGRLKTGHVAAPETGVV
ncbi:MAG: helicase-related protein, partial [Myxococcota bacterium]